VLKYSYMTKNIRKINKFDPALLDNLMKDYNPSKPEELIGKYGLLNNLKKALIERALNAELDTHLGYEKNQSSIGDNYRNGSSSKTIITDDDKIEIETPRDRNSSFEPQIIKKGQRSFNGFNDKIISMYARGMTVSEIQGHLEEIYGVELSGDFISNVTDAIIDEVEIWQNRVLDKIYPVVFLDCLVVKCKENNRVINKAVYLALAINMDGSKEILGFWIGNNEGAKFWLSVITELKNRGIQDVFIFAIDGLKGLPESISSVYPKSQIQLCIVHMVRNSLKFVPFKDRKAVASDLKKIYTAVNCEQARTELNSFKEKWDAKYPTISDSWNRNWAEIVPFLSYPDDIRKAIYTTNSIESVNFTLRKIIKNKQLFPNDLAIKKILYLALKNISKKWTMPIQNWKLALNQFAIIFADRFPDNF
jgi:putative transposase